MTRLGLIIHAHVPAKIIRQGGFESLSSAFSVARRGGTNFKLRELRSPLIRALALSSLPREISFPSYSHQMRTRRDSRSILAKQRERGIGADAGCATFSRKCARSHLLGYYLERLRFAARSSFASAALIILLRASIARCIHNDRKAQLEHSSCRHCLRRTPERCYVGNNVIAGQNVTIMIHPRFPRSFPFLRHIYRVHYIVYLNRARNKTMDIAAEYPLCTIVYRRVVLTRSRQKFPFII